MTFSANKLGLAPLDSLIELHTIAGVVEFEAYPIMNLFSYQFCLICTLQALEVVALQLIVIESLAKTKLRVVARYAITGVDFIGAVVALGAEPIFLLLAVQQFYFLALSLLYIITVIAFDAHLLALLI